MIKSTYIRNTAARAGFVLWENNNKNNTYNDSIDWGSAYDNELETFARCISNDIFSIACGFIQYECGTKAAEALLLHLKKNIKIQETKK